MDRLVTQLKGQISSERVASLEKDRLVRRTMMEGQGQGVVEVFRAQMGGLTDEVTILQKAVSSGSTEMVRIKRNQRHSLAPEMLRIEDF